MPLNVIHARSEEYKYNKVITTRTDSEHALSERLEDWLYYVMAIILSDGGPEDR